MIDDDIIIDVDSLEYKKDFKSRMIDDQIITDVDSLEYKIS